MQPLFETIVSSTGVITDRRFGQFHAFLFLPIRVETQSALRPGILGPGVSVVSQGYHQGAAERRFLDTPPKNYLIDMDGVLMRGSEPISGAPEFIARLVERRAKFLVLTNNSMYTPRDLQLRLRRSGLEVPVASIYTSAMATAEFLHSQSPGGTAYVIGEAGLTTALHEIGYGLVDADPDYVVLGETTAYSFQRITQAVRMVAAGARFVATNRDTAGPAEGGIVPATGAIAALISSATGVEPYFVGKPNPLMVRTALNIIDAHSEDSVMIGDNKDTDVVMGVESGLETILVLTGVTAREDVERHPYRPTRIAGSVAEIMP